MFDKDHIIAITLHIDDRTTLICQRLQQLPFESEEDRNDFKDWVLAMVENQLLTKLDELTKEDINNA